jgi:hypothetical protein
MKPGNVVRLGVGLLAGLLAPPTAVAEDGGQPSKGTHLGFGAGVVGSQDYETRPWLTANIRIPLGSHLWLEPELGYSQRTPDRNDSLSNTVDVGANLLFSSQGKPLRVWAGAGLGLGLLVYRGLDGTDLFGEVIPRVQLLAGVDRSLSPHTTLFGEFSIGTNDFSNGYDLLRQWKAYVGIRWKLKQGDEKRGKPVSQTGAQVRRRFSSPL